MLRGKMVWVAATAVAVGIQFSGGTRNAGWATPAALAQSADTLSTDSSGAHHKVGGLEGEKKLRELTRKEFNRQHSDATGTVRPDLQRKGIEHVHRMKVAPSIGVVPEAAPSSAATTPPAKK
jgi:hypothetical protein